MADVPTPAAPRLVPFWSIYSLGFVGGAVWAVVLALAVYQFFGP